MRLLPGSALAGRAHAGSSERGCLPEPRQSERPVSQPCAPIPRGVPVPTPALRQRNRRWGYTSTGGRRGSAERLPHAWPHQEHTGVPTPARARTTATTTRRLSPAYGTHTPCWCRRCLSTEVSSHPSTCVPGNPALGATPVRLHSPDPLRRATDTPRAALAEQGEDSPADPSSLLHRRPTKCSHQSDLWSQRCPPHCTTSTTGHTAWTAPPLHTCSLEPFPSICPGQTPRKLFTLSKWCDPLSVPQGNVPWDTPKPGQLSAPREQTRADLPANQSIRLKRTCLC